jgi:hypothetical protein
MMTILARRRVLGLGLVVGSLIFGVLPCAAQNTSLPPTSGSWTLNAGFSPDPKFVDLLGGGPIRTEMGGVSAFVADAPNFQLNYTAGTYVLTFYAEAAVGTTLLIKLPNGTWKADVVSGGSFNPMIRIVNPPTGRYDIFVGTRQEGVMPARLFITEQR